jgi:hypothetical protein
LGWDNPLGYEENLWEDDSSCDDDAEEFGDEVFSEEDDDPNCQHSDGEAFETHIDNIIELLLDRNGVPIYPANDGIAHDLTCEIEDDKKSTDESALSSDMSTYRNRILATLGLVADFNGYEEEEKDDIDKEGEDDNLSTRDTWHAERGRHHVAHASARGLAERSNPTTSKQNKSHFNQRQGKVDQDLVGR